MGDIKDDDDLYRRIMQYYFDPVTGRVSSAAFKKKGGKLDAEVSVFLAREADPRSVLNQGKPGQLLIVLPASLPRSVGLKVRRAPIENLPGHCVICDFGDHWKEQCDRLAEGSELYKPSETAQKTEPMAERDAHRESSPAVSPPCLE